MALIKVGLDSLLKAFSSLKKKGQARKQKTALSTVIAELLKIDPDITAAEAKLLAAGAVGAKLTPELLRARQMLEATKAHKVRRAGKPRLRRRAAKRAKRRATKKK